VQFSSKLTFLTSHLSYNELAFKVSNYAKNAGVLTFAVQFSSKLTFLTSHLSYNELAPHPATHKKNTFRALTGPFYC